MSRKSVVLALTGGIAMGKSTALRQFAALGAKCFDADAAVHALLSAGGEGVAPVAAVFPEALKENQIDRKALGQLVFGRPERLRQLETILHPLVRKEEARFIRRMRRLGVRWIVLDIPLLFETRADRRVDATVSVSAPFFLQQQRALRRTGMTKERLAHILSRQWPDSKRRRRADFVIPTGLGLNASLRGIKSVLTHLSKDCR